MSLLPTRRRLVVLAADPDEPSVRFRVRPYEGYFIAWGGELTVLSLAPSLRRRLACYRELRRADAVVVLRRLLMPWETAWLRRQVRRLVFEYDDALPFRDSRRGARPSGARRWKFGALIRAADAVVAGNRYLASLAGPWGREAVVVPTVVEPAPRPRGPAAAGSLPRVGWLGSASTLPYLVARFPALARAAARVPFVLAVMADAPPPGRPGLRIAFTPWHAEEEGPFLAGLTVGLLPQPEDPWTRGKCGLKALQYMAAGVPVLADDVGEIRSVVGPGGRVVRGEGAWVEALTALLTDAAVRRRAGAAGRRWVDAHYSPRRWAATVWRAYTGEEP